MTDKDIVRKTLTLEVYDTLWVEFYALDKNKDGKIILSVDTNDDYEIDFVEYASVLLIRKPDVINVFKNKSNTMSIVVFLDFKPYKALESMRLVVNSNVIIPIEKNKSDYLILWF